jgi:rhodanese-related sulfurtransferase
MATEITREALEAKLDRGEEVVLVEALPPMYYEDAHLPGAINMPHDQVDELAPALLPDTSVEIVVYCANSPCKNSGIAASRLTELGYQNVRDYDAGKQDWIEAGLPTESGAMATNR